MVQYRKNLMLALLQTFDNKLTKTDFQKLLFLFTKQQKNPIYEFVPYKYGCFSFTSMQDMNALVKANKATGNENWEKIDNEDYIKKLNLEDKIFLIKIKNHFGKLKGDELISYVYKQYPFYAIKSEIAKRILTNEEYNKVLNRTPKSNEKILFSIGYEGKSVENYLNELIKNNIQVLVDVRKNPISRKFGFSKNQLKSCVNKIGIKYYHFPELGIESEKRQNLNGLSSYQKLFNEYDNNVLSNNKNYLKNIIEILDINNRIALTCFEKDFNYCHRNRVTSALTKFEEWDSRIKHL